ncbi:MAG: hypothetical protein EOP14_03635 [Pseudomonas sp.]|nr:MAG: hypothetical protein EOP14_03635 [Pseudomonas sp.]
MRITTTGNVGIGTTGPTTKLDVAGTLRVGNGAELCDVNTQYGAIRYNSGNIQFCNPSGWQTVGVSGAGVTALTGDVSATGPGSAVATVNTVGTSSAANIHAAELLANAATSAGTIDTIVKRASDGRFVAGGATFTSSMILKDGTSGGAITLAAPIGSATYGLTLPSVAGTSGYALVSNGSGGSNWVNTATSGPWTVSGADVYRATGNVGIGTATPTNKLDVVGTIGATSSINAFNFNAISSGTYSPLVSYVTSAAANEKYWDFYQNGSTFSLRLPNDAFTASQNAMTITRSATTVNSVVFPQGNLGVGTVSPATRLDVAGSIRVGDGAEACSAATQYGAFRYSGGNMQFCNASGWQTLGVSGAGITSLTGDVTTTGSPTATATISANAVTTGKIADANVTTAKIADANVTLAKLASGSVDSSKIVDLSIATGDIADKAVTFAKIGDLSATTLVGRYTASTGTAQEITLGSGLNLNTSGVLSATGTSQWTTASSNIYYNLGNVGVGTASPSTLLHVEKSQAAETTAQVSNFNAGAAAVAQYVLNTDGNYTALKAFSTAGGAATQLETNGSILGLKSSSATGSILFSTNGANERMRITAAGSVGVGVMSPATKLDVSGSVKIGDGGETCVAGLNGALRFNSSKIQFCVGSAWTDLASGGGGGATNIDGLSDAISVTARKTVYLGSGTGTASTTAVGNTAIGWGAAPNVTTGGSNIAIGLDSGLGLLAQTDNVAIGSNTLFALTAGAGGGANVAIGTSAGFNNSGPLIGARNVMLGTNALKYGAGSDSVAVGYAAGSGSTVSGQVFVGSEAGYDNLGALSVVVGRKAGWTMTTAATENVLMGTEVFFNNATPSTGARNTIIGAYAASDNISHNGNNNVGLGHSVLKFASTGSNNTVLGYSSGNTLTTGSTNILIGSGIQVPTASTSNYMNIGNALYGDLTNARIGIGTSTPYYPLDVVMSGLTASTEFQPVRAAQSTTGKGVYLAYQTNAGGTDVVEGRVKSTGSIPLSIGTTAAPQAIYILNNGKVGIGTNSPSGAFDVQTSTDLIQNFTTTSANTRVKSSYSANVNAGANATSLDIIADHQYGYTSVGTYNDVPLYLTTQNTNRLAIAKGSQGGGVSIGSYAASTLAPANGLIVSGNSGFGVSAPVEKLEVGGNVVATAYLYSSDRRLKKNIVPIQTALNKVLQLNGVTYSWIKPLNTDADREQMGVIAQEVEAVFPQAVTVSADGTKRVNYPMLVAPLIESVKELNAKSEDHSRSIASLEARAVEAEARVKELERRLESKNSEFEARLRALEKSLRLAK